MKHKREQHDELIQRRIDGQQQQELEKQQTEADDDSMIKEDEDEDDLTEVSSTTAEYNPGS
jgi:hypothetical protein